MRLLIITQKVDGKDPVLGFFHKWIEEFAKKCDKLTVICLEKGSYNLPSNINVLSLGKEIKKSKLNYIKNFYKYIWQNRNNYDVVFVHMNQEYVLLGGLFWRFWGKKIGLWRNHPSGNIFTRIASMLAHKIFCTTSYSYTARFNETELMPVGVDTNFFKPDPSTKKNPNSILFLGRIAPVKRVDLFIEILKELQNTGVKFSVTVAGASLPKDQEYEKTVRNKVKKYNLSDSVKFVGAVTQKEALNLYREHEVYVNLTPRGSMDKTIFEAMSVGTLVLVGNLGLKEMVDDRFILLDDELKVAAQALESILKMSDAQKDLFQKAMINKVIEMHSLTALVNRFMEIMGGDKV